MSTSNIIVDLKYREAKNLKYGLKKWADYVCDPEKCDPRSINNNNILQDNIYYSDDEMFLDDSEECLAWNKDGDIDVKRDIKEQELEQAGTIWKLMISFPPDFAINHGLISKEDYYQLTLNILPKFFADAGLKIENINWYASIHRNTKNPHMHISFFQKRNIVHSPYLSTSSITKLKSGIANYLEDNIEFYKIREQEFKNITGTISFEEFTKIKSPKMFDKKYRKELNQKLLALYDRLPKTGRLQYNSKNIKKHKNEIDDIISFILNHDSVKYKYSEYDALLQKHQKELNDMYGISKSNKQGKYYNDQIEKLYSKIGNDILNNFKIYSSKDKMLKEKEFLHKYIMELNFKSRNDYAKDSTKIDIAKGLYKICILADLDQSQTLKIFNKWVNNSKYDFNTELLIKSLDIDNLDIGTTEFYSTLKKLGYDYNRYNKFKNENFYKELTYRRFFNNALNHLLYEIESEEKEIEKNMLFDLDSY